MNSSSKVEESVALVIFFVSTISVIAVGILMWWRFIRHNKSSTIVDKQILRLTYLPTIFFAISPFLQLIHCAVEMFTYGHSAASSSKPVDILVFAGIGFYLLGKYLTYVVMVRRLRLMLNGTCFELSRLLSNLITIVLIANAISPSLKLTFDILSFILSNNSKQADYLKTIQSVSFALDFVWFVLDLLTWTLVSIVFMLKLYNIAQMMHAMNSTTRELSFSRVRGLSSPGNSFAANGTSNARRRPTMDLTDPPSIEIIGGVDERVSTAPEVCVTGTVSSGRASPGFGDVAPLPMASPIINGSTGNVNSNDINTVETQQESYVTPQQTSYSTPQQRSYSTPRFASIPVPKMLTAAATAKSTLAALNRYIASPSADNESTAPGNELNTNLSNFNVSFVNNNSSGHDREPSQSMTANTDVTAITGASVCDATTTTTTTTHGSGSRRSTQVQDDCTEVIASASSNSSATASTTTININVRGRNIMKPNVIHSNSSSFALPRQMHVHLKPSVDLKDTQLQLQRQLQAQRSKVINEKINAQIAAAATEVEMQRERSRVRSSSASKSGRNVNDLGRSSLESSKQEAIGKKKGPYSDDITSLMEVIIRGTNLCIAIVIGSVVLFTLDIVEIEANNGEAYSYVCLIVMSVCCFINSLCLALFFNANKNVYMFICKYCHGAMTSVMTGLVG